MITAVLRSGLLGALVVGIAVPAALGQAQVRSVLAELQTLDRKLVDSEEHLLSIEKRSQALTREAAELDVQAAATRVRRQEAFALYKRRVRALHRMPAGARMALLGGSRSLDDFLEASRVLRWVARHDRKLLDDYQNQMRALAALESRLLARRREHEALVDQARLERDALAAARQERLGLLESAAREGELRRLTAREKKAAVGQLGRVVSGLKTVERPDASFEQQAGRLPWPATGAVDVKFGQRVERTFGTTTSHNGWDIRARAGAPVQAVARGRVVFANWLKGYGQIVIIDHGQHFHTLSGHLSRVEVSVGGEVQAGDVIGLVGDTGSLRGTVLYFEVRKKSVPVDPARWLRRSPSG